MPHDPKYRIKHKPPKIDRLLRWKHLPPRMVGDPEPCYHVLPSPRWGKKKDPWQIRCEAVYEHMMMIKRGGKPPVPRQERRGLWMWSVRDERASPVPS